MSDHNLPQTAPQNETKSLQRESETEDEQPLQMKHLSSLAVTPRNAMQLQRTLGNAAVQRMITQKKQSHNIQREGEEENVSQTTEGESTSQTTEEENTTQTTEGENVSQTTEGESTSQTSEGGKSSKPSFEEIIHKKADFKRDRGVLTALQPFAKTMFAEENIDCQLMILDYKGTPSEDRLEIATQIQNTFLDDNSPKQVNLGTGEAQSVADKISNGEYPDDLFDVLSRTLVINMFDTANQACIQQGNEAKNFQNYLLERFYGIKPEKPVEKPVAKPSTFSKIKNTVKKGFGALASLFKGRKK